MEAHYFGFNGMAADPNRRCDAAQVVFKLRETGALLAFPNASAGTPLAGPAADGRARQRLKSGDRMGFGTHCG
jgi:hypothetical protein